MARELLRALRGQRSQVAFARRLGYKGNPVADWEAGRRFPTVLEMLRAYEKVTGDAAAAFARFHPGIPARLTDGTLDIASWLSALRGLGIGPGHCSTSQALSAPGLALAQGSNAAARSRFPSRPRCDHRARNGPRRRTRPDRPCPVGASRLGAPPGSPHARARRTLDRSDTAHHRKQAIPEPARALQRLRGGRARPFARGRPALPEQADAAGIIAQRGGRYEPVQALTVDTRAIGKLREHWAGVAAERVRAPRPDDIFSYNVLSASRADMERIDALLRCGDLAADL